MTFLHIAIIVTDLERTIKWYDEVFGLKVVKTFQKESLEIRGALLSNDVLTVEAIVPDGIRTDDYRYGDLTTALKPQGLNHFALAVDDIKKFYQKLKERKETIVSELIEDRLFFLTDPDGTLMEIKQK